MDCSLQTEAIGTSGSLESILTVCEANGFSRHEVTVSALGEIERAIVSGFGINDLGMLGLPPERVDIFPARVAIVSALMESLAIERIIFCSTTLTDGVLYDSIGSL